MLRWAKISDNQYFGFWALGIVFFVIQEIPYMSMPMFHLETDPIMNMTETSVALNFLEKVLGIACIVLMIFIAHKDAVLFSVSDGKEKVFFTLAVVFLLTYYFGWALYFTGHQSMFVMMVF